MARRNDHTREELIDLTLTTVRDYLNENSYHSLSLRKIATLIGYVPSTLVNIFGSYNLLLLHAVARTVDELSEESRQVIEKTDNAEQALYALAICYHDFAKKYPYRWQLIFEHNMNGDQLPEWQSQRIDGMTGMLEHLLSELRPERSPADVMKASRVLWAGVHGITLLSVDDKFFTSEPIDGSVLIKDLISNYLKSW
ncbi:TetR/AcrR family transcriptional regulator [Vibrio variabilis]|uniref:TetR/AcrR family transcriptional regulator n=1 Tax=Vibrio variabilis TaxID=990271 RepID=UPI0005AA9747|nr:TetR-like C-terminal domain-containing protein [Vibrio variabilis]